MSLTLGPGESRPIFYAVIGAEMTLEGGRIGSGMEIVDSVVNVESGIVEGYMSIFSGGEVTVTGGELERAVNVGSGGALVISGGEIDGVSGAAGSDIEIFATEFLLDGAPIAGLNAPGDSVLLTAREGTLSAELLDGNYFRLPLFHGRGGATFHPAATIRLSLPVAAIPEPNSCCLWLIVGLALVCQSRRSHRYRGH